MKSKFVAILAVMMLILGSVQTVFAEEVGDSGDVSEETYTYDVPNVYNKAATKPNTVERTHNRTSGADVTQTYAAKSMNSSAKAEKASEPAKPAQTTESTESTVQEAPTYTEAPAYTGDGQISDAPQTSDENSGMFLVAFLMSMLGIFDIIRRKVTGGAL